MKHSDFVKAHSEGNKTAMGHLDFLREHSISMSLKLLEFGQQYELEAVKHLAIINSAGIAAVAALYATKTSSDHQPLIDALKIFSFGMILSVLTMFSAAVLLFYSGSRIIKQWGKFTKDEIPCSELSPKPKHENIWHIINLILGFASFALFLIGVYYCKKFLEI
ncbi:hypothetical protein [Chromobacterium haemolyticum]|uniref:hypothetical protein n=1 Tax=Chromobacterium haemolyticum TaxID=394935 RepID=UPI001745C7B7|nr:hypothetical protein [Chromobacterium haemolyticum]QOD81893.1 hypothetical protein IEZ30_18665 [Chromobacterium haemolyticum]